MLNVAWCLVHRDLLLAVRRPGDVINILFFFVIVATLFPLAVGPEREALRMMAPGIVWASALLASILSLPRLFAADHADGTLEGMLLSIEPLPVIVIAKVVAHWLVSGLPLALVAPLLAVQFDLPADAATLLFVSLLLGTPVLSLVGATGAALTLGLRGGSVLVALLVLPLYVPVLIFGAGAAAAGPENAAAHLLVLGSLLAAALALTPWATAAALRISME